MKHQIVIIGLVLFPLLGALIAGLGGKAVSCRLAHRVTILGVALSFILSLYFAYQFFFLHGSAYYDSNLYLWDLSGKFRFNIGFLIDPLTLVMFVIVTFVSLIVHIYSIAYMAGDPGYKRFFSYMSAFTFAMLMLVSANNFLQLYFGWEAVGLISYLLIGFWFKRESANAGSLKAFIVNRVGDFGFLLGIALLFNNFGSLDYLQVFHHASQLKQTTVSIFPGTQCSVITLICFLLFIGAMGKSAQMPLHVWLPESMEGPTPISALIHAATMVTAGVYLVARLSPLYEYSPTVLNIILVLGASTALFMGLIAIVQNDIKRVIAYSTLSQLGYMMVALGASAYAAGIFHLVTHAFFKALLFLAAGSVIIALHHEQDMRKMGGLGKFLPITTITFLIGALALAAVPPFAGFYSKDAIIEAVYSSHLPAAHYAYYCVLIGALVTAFYIFRAFFLVFFSKERFSTEQRKHLRESPAVVTFSLIALAIPSLLAGYLLSGAFLNPQGFLSPVLFVLPQHRDFVSLAATFSPIKTFLINNLALIFALLGIVLAWLCYSRFPAFPNRMQKRFSWFYQILVRKYGFDELYQTVFANGGRRLANFFFRADANVLDKRIVDGSARRISWLSSTFRHLQSGYLYEYAWIMVLGIVIFLLIFSL
ncbi:MAG: NADH-quinone oxidoreductase subunit L [Pseudomonadota bacterium]